MGKDTLGKLDRPRAVVRWLGIVSGIVLAGAVPARAQKGSQFFTPGNLVVSRSVYDNDPNNVQVGELLPPDCSSTQGGCSGNATNDGTYPYVFNNALIDVSFGITSAIYLDQYTPAGVFINSLEVPNSSQKGVPPTKDQLVTSFSSKSELALNLSLDGQYLTFMGYYSAVDTLDVSNSNTPLEIDPTNPVGTSYNRAVAQLNKAT
jgi:hypothetical protein